MAIGFLFGLAIYFAPTIVALLRNRAVWPVLAVNALLAWTVIGWIVAMIWACTKRTAAEIEGPPKLRSPKTITAAIVAGGLALFAWPAYRLAQTTAPSAPTLSHQAQAAPQAQAHESQGRASTNSGGTLQKSAAMEPSKSRVEPGPRQTKWMYSLDSDAMRGTINRWAMVESDNVENMGFPYNRVRVMLQLRRRSEDGLNIYFHTETGQFHCGYRGCSVKVKFDDGPIQTFSVAEAASSVGDYLFIQNETRFLAGLRRSKRMILEANFFSHGPEQFTFQTADLEWE